MAGIIVSTASQVEQPPGSNANNPASLPAVTYSYAVLGVPQTWTAKQTFPLGNISVQLGDIIPAVAPLNSPALTGSPTAPSPPIRDNSLNIATTAWVRNNAAVGSSVIAFGAKADGVTDDTAAWQAAINYQTSVGGGPVWIPLGTTLLAGSVQLKSGVYLVGYGINSYVKLANGAVTSLFLNADGTRCWFYTSTGTTGVGMDNFLLDGNNTNNTTVLRGASFENTTDVSLRRMVVANTYGTAIGFGAVTTFEVFDCRFRDLTGNYPAVPGNPGEAIYAKDVTDGIINGIRGVNIDDHLVYLDGSGAVGTDSVAIINAIGRNCGRAGGGSAFNVYQNVKNTSFTDCHAIGSGGGFTCITSTTTSLFPTDIEWNNCTVTNSNSTSEAFGWSFAGLAARVTGRYRLNSCKVYNSGAGIVVVGNGFRADGIDDIEFNDCTASNSNDNGFYLTNVTNFKIEGRAINNSRRGSGAFDGVRLGTATAGTQCLAGSVNVLATDTASGTLAAPVANAPTTSATGGTLAAATYYYKVTALTATGETTGSNEVSIATTGTTSTVTVTWSAVPGVLGYRVYRGTVGGGENVYYAPGNVTTYTDTNAASTAGSPPVTNTASAKLQGYGVQILGTSDNIDVTGKLTGNLSGTLLLGASVTNSGLASVTSLAGNAGAFTLSSGLANVGNDVRFAPAAALTTTTVAVPNTGAFTSGQTAAWRYWQFGKIVYFEMSVTPIYTTAGGYITVPLPVGIPAADTAASAMNTGGTWPLYGFMPSGVATLYLTKYDGTFPMGASGQKIVANGFYETT